MAEESSGAGYIPVPVILEPEASSSNDDDPNNDDYRCRRIVSERPASALPADPSEEGVDETTPLNQESRQGDPSDQYAGFSFGDSAVAVAVAGSSNAGQSKDSQAQQGLKRRQQQQQLKIQSQADEQQQQQQQQQNEDSEEELLFPGFTPKTFYFFTQTNFLRRLCLRCITWPWFERISMFVIILNCITLGMYQPCADVVCDTVRCQMLEAFDHFIFAFFAIEMIIKMMAMGVFGKETYLAESWNRLDCFIVVAGTIEYAVDTENLSISAIRTIRVLRPLRAINRIPSMRILVTLLLDTLPMLGNVLLLCFFVFFIFGIIGVQLWSGVLRHRCYLDVNESVGVPGYVSEYYDPKDPKKEFICSGPNQSGIRKCVDLPRFQYEGIQCNGTARLYSNNTPTNDSCVNWNQYYTNCIPRGMNPFKGAVSFDNIGHAWIAIFQVISLESWVNIMYYVQDAHSFWDWIYFVALIVIGSFFMVNLCLVVIATQFSETKKRETERMMQERKRFQSCSTLASNSEPGGCYAELLKYIAQIYRRLKRKAIRAYVKHRGLQKINPEKSLSLRRKKTKKKAGLFADNLLMDMVTDKHIGSQLAVEGDGQSLHLHAGFGQPSSVTVELEGEGGQGGSGGRGDKELAGEPSHGPSTATPSGLLALSSPVRADTVDSDCETSKEESRGSSRSSNVCGYITMFQKRAMKFVESNLFQRSILGAIVLNTLSMAMEFHNQPALLTTTLEYSNIVFCALFGVEMTCKIVAYGLFGYISNGFDVFDGFIVILSIVELAQGGASGLSVLRTFRLLRILKLVRFMPALRRQLVVMLRTMDNVATFFALLVLFMFIFSILGMNLFGCKFCQTKNGVLKCDRKNFDSLLWAIITVFQVLTQEDWNTVLYNGMSRTSSWASIYFIALMTFGNYVLFNLLVAILVEGFHTEDEEKKKDKAKEDEDGLAEESEEQKEKQRLAENNNIDDIQGSKTRLASIDLDVKNNKEKEKKMLALPAATVHTKYETPAHLQASDGPLNPPIITHTAATPMATPMATPQGSPNENAIKDTNHKLSVAMKKTALKSTLSVDSDKAPNVPFRAGSPRPSPCVKRSNSRGSCHQRSASWRLRNRRARGDKTSLVVDSQSDSADDVDDDVFSSTHSQSPTYSAGTGRAPSVNAHGDCNGHPPLNNQRTLSPQNSLKGRALTPHNSFKSCRTWSRNNSVGSGRSICNSFELSRQNSFTSHRTLNSLGSGTSKDDNRPGKNVVDLPDVKIALDKEEGREDDDDDQDPDAIDETDWNCSWCPEPTGCFLTRHEYSFYIMSNENTLRKCCHYLISRAWFDNLILFFIALNCITLAMERPSIPPASTERTFLTYSNYVFTFVFAVEMVIKVLAKGFFVGKHAYLKSGWNVMDGFLVMISLIDIFISLSANSSPRIFGILRVFRLLRTLRPLRVISRAPGLKLVVQTLLSSLRPIGNIVIICITFFIIFGILGVQLFKGTFYHCKGPNVTNIVNKSQCTNDTRNNWVNQKYNFDNVGQALMALFVLASKDGWVQIMYTGLDAVGVDQQPIENYNEWRLLYFISFLLLVAFFVLNMFVGVVVENFHKCRESQEIEERAKRAAKRQEKLDKKRKKMREPPYWANYSHSRLFIHTVINSKYFDLAIAAVISLNVITMATEYYMMPEELQFALKIFNFFFTSVFILEAVMKIVALGLYRYIKDRWNQLDILIVILSVVGIILEEMRTNVIPINPTIIRVMRVLRIARVLKLLKMAKGIRALLDTVIQALPQVGNLGLLFFLLFFIFAALGVELFGRLVCNIEHPCEGLGKHAHFKNFGMAFLTLFRVATGDNWNGIMKDTLREDCDRADDCVDNCCVSALIAPVYFVVFVLMAQFVLVNVVVAVLMKHLEETYKYKELDDELDEELRAEMLAIALGGKAAEVDDMDSKESNRMVDEDALLLSDALAACNKDLDTKENMPELEILGGQRASLPSFSFNVRPPSEEQSRSEDNAGASPMNASLTIEGLASSWSSMDSNRLAVTPSMTGSSPNSERSVRISSPPIKRAPSPYLLSLQGRGMHRRPLVKQYSMDVGSDPQLNNIEANNQEIWEKLHSAPKPSRKNETNMYRSQPSLNMRQGSVDSKADSLDSKEAVLTGDRLPARDRMKHKLLRSRSSGAKYSRFRDKYKQSNLNKSSAYLNSDTTLVRDKVKKSNRTGSLETGSDMEDSLCSDWGSEEAACDEEVKMITGGTEDEEDDIRPTLSPYASEDRDYPPSTASRTYIESAGSSSQSTTRADSTPRLKSSHPKCKSPMPPPLKSTRTPGIDNNSFEMGEEMHIPPCCKARDTVALRRSNSFSPSKLVTKALSPPMVVSPRSDRSLSPAPYGFREHTTPVSPLALPPSPLALEDSTYKLRTPEGGLRDSSVSPVPFAHSNMLTVPSGHPHMRSPSPTPPKQVHLAPPTLEGAMSSRRQIHGSPAPIRRQHTLSRSSAVDYDTGPTRRSIPHTLSVDSAFLVPPGLPQSYSINDPFVELHGGCRASSPLPSPRNSQQTLPGMFTRSASPSVPQQQQQQQLGHHASQLAKTPSQQPLQSQQSQQQSSPPQQQQHQQRKSKSPHRLAQLHHSPSLPDPVPEKPKACIPHSSSQSSSLQPSPSLPTIHTHEPSETQVEEHTTDPDITRLENEPRDTSATRVDVEDSAHVDIDPNNDTVQLNTLRKEEETSTETCALLEDNTGSGGNTDTSSITVNTKADTCTETDPDTLPCTDTQVSTTQSESNTLPQTNTRPDSASLEHSTPALAVPVPSQAPRDTPSSSGLVSNTAKDTPSGQAASPKDSHS